MHQKKINPIAVWPSLLGVLACALVACSGADPKADAKVGGKDAAKDASKNAPVAVTTVKVVQRDVSVPLRASGTVAAIDSVDIKSQVSSMVTQVHVAEGQLVSKGQLLVTLDSRTDEATTQRSKAQLQKDQASLADAQRQLDKAQQLFAQQFVSQSAVDTARTLVDTWRATVQNSQAALDASLATQSYTRMVAPQAGRVGLIPIAQGSVVQANATVLMSITRMNPIEVLYTVPQQYVPQVLKAQQAKAPVQVQLPGSADTATGYVKFIDSAVDAQSGMMKVKALFDNTAQKLWPGMLVDVTQALTTLPQALVVPQAALIQSPKGTKVYVVTDGQAQPKPIEVLQSMGLDAVVQGLSVGDVVVLDGRQNLKPGSKVIDKASSSSSSSSNKSSTNNQGKSSS